MNDLSPLPTEDRDPSYVEAFARGLRVIRAFGEGRESMTLADIARATALPRATVRRSLFTLGQLGYVTDDGRQFRLTPKILSLGYAYLSSTPLPRIILPALEQVSEQVHESCSAAILDGPEIVYVARSATKRIMSVGLAVGSRLPAYCTSLGRVLLAHEPIERQTAILAASTLKPLTPKTVTDPARLLAITAEVARIGYAFVDEELELGLRSIAVPVTNATGHVVAAINVSTQASRVSQEIMCTSMRLALVKAANSVRSSLL